MGRGKGHKEQKWVVSVLVLFCFVFLSLLVLPCLGKRQTKRKRRQILQQGEETKRQRVEGIMEKSIGQVKGEVMG
jgi:hypothetical protein